MKELADLEAKNQTAETELNVLLKQISQLEEELKKVKSENEKVSKQFDEWKQAQEQAKIQAEAEKAKKKVEEERVVSQSRGEPPTSHEGTSDDEKFLKDIIDGKVDGTSDESMARLESLVEKFDVEGNPLRDLIGEALNVVANSAVNGAKKTLAA